MAANVQLAWAKMYLYRLQASHSVHVLRHPLEPPCAYPTPATFPPMLAFHQSSALQLPPIESLPWGDAALAASFEGARELFNAAMPRFKTALEYYKLDGWVTEHVRIVMEMSNLYRCLAGFEGDHRRRCAMHKARAKLLVPLSGGQLNAAHHLGLVRSVELELGNVHRQLSELHEDAADSAGGGGDRVQARAEGDKAAAHSQEAIKHYEAFLATFKSKDGKMPEGRIEDAANEGYFLTAAFSCSRLMLRKPSSSSKRDTALLQQAHTQLCWAIDYVECHKLGEFAQEAKLGKELAALLAENMRVNALAAAAAAAAR